VAAFGCQAETMGVFFEKDAEGKRTATAGWYNSTAFEHKVREAGLYTKSFNGDAFSDEMKTEVVRAIKKDWGSVDGVIYSLASPRRQHPRTGKVSKSVLRPIGKEYTNTSIDMSTDKLETVTLPPATEQDIEETVAVMGGEDWEFWMDALEENGLLAEGILTAAYSYIGPEITRGVYRNGTIGKAKDHLEATAKRLHRRLQRLNGRAFISVNKALVTQSSSAIPFIPLYFILLNKVMKEKRLEEGCIEQIYRLFSDCLYNGSDVPVDENGFIRLDDREMRGDIQREVAQQWGRLNDQNLKHITDLEGYHKEFLKLFGFGFENINYELDVDPDQKLLSVSV
jgi:enoyl-[acyl-carrier protein] reductase/trans-2-enoyl-CoA reductase (NAD+)